MPYLRLDQSNLLQDFNNISGINQINEIESVSSIIPSAIMDVYPTVSTWQHLGRYVGQVQEHSFVLIQHVRISKVQVFDFWFHSVGK